MTAVLLLVVVVADDDNDDDDERGLSVCQRLAPAMSSLCADCTAMPSLL